MISPRRLLPAVLVLALAVRVWGIDFGMPWVNARPDETQIAGPAVGFLSGNLRPPLLEWPTLFPYVVALCYLFYYAVTRPFGGYQSLQAFAESRRADISPFIYIPRALSMAMGVVTVWGVYAMAKRTFDSTIAIVAALFLALSFLHVRDSHFGVADVPMSALVVLSVLAIMSWRQKGGVPRALFAGIVTGLATSTKYNALGVVVPFAVAVIQRLLEEHQQSRAVVRAVTALAVFGVGLAAGLFTTSPYILIDWARFVRSAMATESMIALGHGMVLGRGWWYYARVVLPAALGSPIFIAGAVATVVLTIKRFRECGVVFAFPLAYYLVAGRGYGVFARYILPVLPFICIAAAWVTVEAARALTRRRSVAVQQTAVVVATIVMVWPTAYQTLLLDRLLSRTDNRTITGRSLMDIIPPDSVFYQSGETYGYASLSVDGRRLQVRLTGFDPQAGRFAPDDPDWILIQRSPLVLYSDVPAALERLLTERYALARRFPTGNQDRVDRSYDQQDAFYLPLAGLEGIDRPGPSFDLYSKRHE